MKASVFKLLVQNNIKVDYDDAQFRLMIGIFMDNQCQAFDSINDGVFDDYEFEQVNARIIQDIYHTSQFVLAPGYMDNQYQFVYVGDMVDYEGAIKSLQDYLINNFVDFDNVTPAVKQRYLLI